MDFSTIFISSTDGFAGFCSFSAADLLELFELSSVIII